jgi:hypothetical protein
MSFYQELLILKVIRVPCHSFSPTLHPLTMELPEMLLHIAKHHSIHLSMLLNTLVVATRQTP